MTLMAPKRLMTISDWQSRECLRRWGEEGGEGGREWKGGGDLTETGKLDILRPRSKNMMILENMAHELC